MVPATLKTFHAETTATDCCIDDLAPDAATGDNIMVKCNIIKQYCTVGVLWSTKRESEILLVGAPETSLLASTP